MYFYPIIQPNPPIMVQSSEATHHIAEQSKLTKSHLWGLKLKESAN